jgi:4-amino-4-deoxy-L-arabinose transferase-like glycosyltransferase
MIQKYRLYIAGALIALCGILSFTSMLGDSATMDEQAHIPAGYSYLKYADYRINPEHPPLAKDIAAFPLQFLNLKFPTDNDLWTQYRKDYGDSQWDAGRVFLYGSGNDADTIVFYSHLGPLLLTLLFAFYIFKGVTEWFGKKAGLLALFFYALSPTVLAHGHLVTTDIAAAFGIFIGIYYYLRFLKTPSIKTGVYAGIALGIALLLKFSTVLLIPLFCALAFVKFIQSWKQGAWLSAKTYLVGTVLIFVVALATLFPLYFHHTYNYPPERQRSDTESILASFAQGPDPEGKACDLSSDVSFARRKRCLANTVIWMSDKPVLRAWGQYFLGFLMVVQRAVGGNTTYFMGEVSRLGWHDYFPIMYALKEPLSMHFLTLVGIFMALGSLGYLLKRFLGKQDPVAPGAPQESSPTIASIWRGFLDAIGDKYLTEVALLVFLAAYWGSSITSNLNIGVRHLMPVMPLMYALTSRQISVLIDRARQTKYYKHAVGFLIAVLAFQMISVIAVFPSFLSYFNEIVGTDNGYKYAVDSNYDWGQDLKRLKKFVDDNNIQRIGINYFGAGDLNYYFGNKAEGWWSAKGPQDLEWFAISSSFLMGSLGTLDAEMTESFGPRKPEDSYSWLPDPYHPYARAGRSILIYKLK